MARGTPSRNLFSTRTLYALLPRPLRLVVIWYGIGMLLLHLWCTGWFLAHNEITEAAVVKRKDYAFIGRRHGLSSLEVSYLDSAGNKRTEKLDWHLTAAPQGDTVMIRRADSGLIRAEPASLAEVLWLEVWAVLGCLVFGVFALIAMSIPKVRRWRKSRRSNPANPFTKSEAPDKEP
jgi:hypothetical protein